MPDYTPPDAPEEMPPGMGAGMPSGDFEPPMGGPEPGPAPEAPKPSGREKLNTFVATPKGKAIAIGGAVGFLLVFGVVVFMVMSIVAKPPQPSVTVTGTTGGPPAMPGAGGSAPGTGATSASSTQTAANGGEEGLPEAFEVFENRDPFQSFIIPSTSTEESATTGGTGTSSVTVNQSSSTADSGGDTTGGSSDGGSSGGDSGGGTTDTSSLTLESITYSGGEYSATFTYGGKSYTVQAGDQIDNSPWEVQWIKSSSAGLVYGDSDEIVLTLS